MAYKILTKNGIDNSNIDGARGEYFNSGMRNGIVQGVLNEGTFIASSSNVISFDTCELRIAGHRIVIDEPVYHTFTNAPSSDTRYAYIAQIIVGSDQNVDFSLFVQSASTSLIQNELYKTISGAGTYQVEIGRFTLTQSLLIEDVVRTIDVITGGTGVNGGDYIKIGQVTTTTTASGTMANVDIENVERQGEMQTDFNFDIPAPIGTTVVVAGEEQESVSFTSDPQTQLNNKVDKEEGKGLSTNDYTTDEKNKLANIEAGAQVNAPTDDALSTTSTNPIQNKVVTENINNTKVLTGTGVPSVLDGVVGQLYLDTASKRLYQCVSQEYDDSGNVHRKWEELITKKYLEYDWEYVTTYILNQTSDAHWAIVPNFDFENYDYYFESTLILENGGFNGLMFTDANSNVLTFNVRWNRIATEGGSGSGSSTTWAGYQAVREDNLIYGVDTMSGSYRFIRETIKLSRQANTTGSDDSGPNIDYEFNSWASYAGSQRNYMVRGYVYPTDTTSTLSIKGISRFVGEGTAGYLPNSFMRMYRRKRRNETGG